MKKAILVVSFGTSFDETREKTIGAIEKEIAKEFPDYIVKRAFTSGVIMNNLAKRGIIIPNVVTALEELSAQGVTDVFVQPTHIIPGEEYDKLVSMAESCKDKFSSFKIGKPLMWNENDYKNVSDFLIKEYGDTEKAVVLMGHGTEHRANDVYLKLSDILEGHNIFVGTVESKPDIYDVLKKKSDYSDFLDFYSQYSTYAYDKDLSADYGKAVGVDSLFLHAHSPNGLPNIALEWPTPNFRLYPELASISYSIFAPSNQALNTFFNRYWKAGGYSSLTDLDPLITKILLYQSVYGGSIVFPDEISGITNSLGSHYDFQLSDVKDKSICVNGSFYGLSNFPMPEIFSTVMGPSFLKRDYLLSLYAIFQSNQMAAYTTTATNYTMLITKNSGYEISDMRLMSDGVGNTLATSGEDGDVAVSTSDLKRIVSGGTVVGDVNFNTPWAVYATQDGGTYWFVKDGKMTTNYVFNSVLGQDPQTVIPTLFTEVKEVTNDAGGSWANGKVYEYESDFGVFGKLDGLEYTSLRTMLTSIGETKYPNFVFAYLMRQAELFATIDGVLAWDYRLAGRLIGFIPTNEALKEALDNDRIPGVKGTIDLSLPSPTLQGEITNQYLLREYLLNYFFTPTNAPVASGCPYLGSPDWLSGEYRNSNNIPVKYTDNGAFITLQLQNQTTGQYGNACKIVSYENFPFAFMDGAFHLIDAVFN